jgi:FMN-dependent NADH-azoreductase
LNERLPQVDNAWIEANNTPADDHTDEQRKTLLLSDKLVAEIEVADTLIIGGTQFGSDIDFASGYLQHILSFIGITDVTFISADKSGYLQHILSFIGITDVTFISADKHFMDSQSLTNANATVDALIKKL